MFTIIAIIGILGFLFMFHRILDKKEYEWLLVIPFYAIFYAFALYQLDKILPDLIR